MRLIILFNLLFISFLTVRAGNYTWNGSINNSASNAINWTPSGVPGAADSAIIVSAPNSCLLQANRSVTMLTISSGNLDLGGNVLTVTGDVVFSGGTVSNGNLTVTAGATKSASFNGTTFSANVALTATTGSILINGGIYNGPVSINQTGNVTTSGGGGATFNGITNITNSGTATLRTNGNIIFNGITSISSTGTTSAILLDNASANSYNADVTFTNSSTGVLYASYNGATYFNGNIKVNSTNTGNMVFGVTGSNINYLKAGSTLTIGASGFSSGVLTLKQFNQLGADTTNLLFTGTAGIILGSSSVFNGVFNVTAPDITVAGTTFNSSAAFTKTGGGNNHNNGFQNIFNSSCTINQQSNTGYFMLGYMSHDLFNGDVIVSSTGSGTIYLGYTSGTGTPALAAGKTIQIGSAGYSKGLLNIGTFSQVSTVPMNLTLSGTAGINIGYNSTFNSTVNITAPDIYVTGNVFNDSVTFTKTGGGNNHNGSNQNIFNSVCNINQQSNTGYFMLGYNSHELFNDDIVVSSTGAGAIYLGYIAGTGTPTLAPGKTIRIGSAGYSKGNLTIGTFMQLSTVPLQLTLTGTAGIYIGYNSTFNSTVNIIAPDITAAGSVYNDSITFTKTGGGNNHNSGYQNIFNSACIINQQSNTGYFMLGYNSHELFNGDIIVSSTGNGGIYLGYISGSGSPVLSAGKTIKIGSAGYSKGFLSVGTFTQSGTVPLNLLLTGTSALYLGYNSVFNATVNVTAPDLTLVGNIFNDSLTVTKTGGGDNHNSGRQNIFNSTCTINQQSNTGYFMLSYNSHDLFNDDIIVTSSGSRQIYLGFPSGTGTPELASGKTIRVGASGFSSGQLFFGSFTQLGNAPVNLPFTALGSLNYFSSTFGGDINCTGYSIVFQNSTFKGFVNAVKHGSVLAASPGGNKFYKDITLTENGSAGFTMASASPDSCFQDVYLNANGTGYLYFAQIAPGNFVAGNVNISNAGTGNMAIILATQPSSSLTVNGKISAFNVSPGSVSYITLAAYGKLFVNGTLDITNSNSAGAGYITLAQEVGSLLQVGGDVTIQNNAVGATSSLTLGSSGNVNINGGFTFTNSASSATLASFTAAYYGASTVNISGTSTFVTTGSSPNSSLIIARNGIVNFGNTLQVTNSSTGNSSTIFLGVGTGSAVDVAGIANFINNGSGTAKRIIIGNIGNIVFDGTLTLENNSSATNSEISLNAAGLNLYNDNIVISSTDPASDGIWFGNFGGYGTLATGKTITLGSGGFIAGQLYFRNFTQIGPTAQSLLLTAAGWFTNYDSNWGGNVTFVAPKIDTRGTIYNGTTYLEKTGSYTDNSLGLNKFMQHAELRNSGNGIFTMGNTYADSAFQNVVMNNTGSGDMNFANNNVGHYIAGNLTVNNVGSGSANNIGLSNYNGAGVGPGHTSLYIGGNTILNNASAATSSTITSGAYGDITYNGTLDVINSSTGAASSISFGGQNTSVNTVNGAATFLNNSTAGTSNFYIGFSGRVNFNNTLTCSNLSTGTASNVNFGYNGTGIINASGDAYFLNSGSSTANFMIGWYADVTFGSKLTCINNVAGNTGAFVLASTSAADISVAGTASFTNSGAGTTKQIYIGASGNITFNGALAIYNNSTATNSQVYCNHGGTNFYNGNVTLESTTAATDGILFGQSGTGFGTLAAGKTISLSSGGFVAGTLLFRHFTQLSSTPQNIILTGTGWFSNYDSQWNGDVIFKGPQLDTRGTLYNRSADLEKTGAVNDNSYGANIFNGNAIITNSGGGNMITGGTAADDFNADASYVKKGIGLNQPTYNAASTYAGNININSITPITLAQSTNGRVIFDGVMPQSVNDLETSAQPQFGKITTANLVSDITLNMPVSVIADLKLNDGNIVSSPSNLITMLAGSGVSAVSDNAFVQGPCRKIGNTAFSFPVGKNGYYRPVSISAPGNAAYHFTAEYFEDNPRYAVGFNTVLGIHHISYCEYWRLDRTNGNTNVNVTLSYRDFDNATGCSGVLDPASLVVSPWNGTAWSNAGNGGTSGTAANGTIVSLGAVTTYGPITIATTNGNNPLPVSLVLFDAVKQEKQVSLNWITASETNNDYFTIEHSVDGTNFKPITKVDGAGNSTQILKYAAADESPAMGINYYRLKQTDFNGAFTYSDVKSVYFDSSVLMDELSVFPNPNNGNFVIGVKDKVAGAVELKITDVAGKIIYNNKITADVANAFKLQIHAPAGVYLVFLVSENKTYQTKMILR